MMDSFSDAGTHCSTLSGFSLSMGFFTPFKGSVRIDGSAYRRFASVSREGVDGRERG